MVHKSQVYDKGLLWDENDRVIKQSWAQIRDIAKETHGGLGILAADFHELIRYGYGEPEHRRKIFKRIVAEATEDDVEFLAEILSCMLCSPWKTNPDAAWFIYLLRRGKDLDEFDAERAAKVLNELHTIHPYAASVLVRTLEPFVEDIEAEIMTSTRDLIVGTGLLNDILLLDTKPTSIFISYAREDDEVMERIYEELKKRFFAVWKDNHSLEIGENWQDEIEKRLQSTDLVVIGVSEVAMNKVGFFRIELEWALQRSKDGRSHSLLPVRLDDLDLGQIPAEIRNLHFCDLRHGVDAAVSAIEQSLIHSRAGWRYRH